MYLKYFWCIKYQHINIYMKIGKGNGKRKKKKGFSTSWAGGEFLAQPSASARGRVGKQPTRPASGGDGVGTVSWCGPTCQRKGG
jgi:hypothetical protein